MNKKKLSVAMMAASLAAGFAGKAQAGTQAGANDPALIAHGKYLATAGDCVACHTAKNGKPYAGGLYMDTPFGKVATPNITPDDETGIGKITDDQFYRVFHEGIGMNGEHLYPVMPFPWYTKVTRDDVLAIKAYLFSLPPVHAPDKPNKMAFPFNIRAALIGWDLVFLKDSTFKPDPAQSAQVNRGAYLVQGLAHCGECHNGNSILGDSAASHRLRGGPIDKWYAPNITSDKAEGIGKYSDAQLFQYLKTGTAPGMGVVVGPMAQTMHESLGKLTDDDLHDIVLYLKSTPSKQGYTKTEPARGNPILAVTSQSYLNYCASCHGQDGKGLGNAVPNLAGNGSVASGGPQTVMRVILGGVLAQGSYAPMPAIGARMTDQEVADATNYVRSAWGNGAPATAGAGLAGQLRAKTQTVLAMNVAGGCPKVADGPLAKAIASPDVQSLLQKTTAENTLENAGTLLKDVKHVAPGAKPSDIINALTLGYCPVVAANSALATQAQKSEALDGFADQVYTESVSKE